MKYSKFDGLMSDITRKVNEKVQIIYQKSIKAQSQHTVTDTPRHKALGQGKNADSMSHRIRLAL